MSDEIIVNSAHTKELFLLQMEKLYDEHKYLRLTVKTGKQRTNKQNRSLHLYLGMLSEQLNNAGYDMKKTLKPSVEIPWSTELAKEYLWRPIQKAMTKQTSTTKPKTSEYPKIYEVLSRHMAQKFGVSVAWPSSEDK